MICQFIFVGNYNYVIACSISFYNVWFGVMVNETLYYPRYYMKWKKKIMLSIETNDVPKIKWEKNWKGDT